MMLGGDMEMGKSRWEKKSPGRGDATEFQSCNCIFVARLQRGGGQEIK